MKYAIVGSLTALLAGAGLALAQQPDIETLPNPRNSSAPSREGAPEQGTMSVPGLPPTGPGVEYGPPPPMIAPVCGTQGYPFRIWAEGDYHLWWVKQNHFPPLLEAIPLGGIGAPGTAVLAGGDNTLDRPQRNGGGLTLGAWFTDYQGFGIEGSFFVMESSSKSFDLGATSAAGTPVIGRPFFNVLNGLNGFAILSAPGLFGGSSNGETEGIHCDSGQFFGVGFDFIGNICCDTNCRFDFLVGYRYLQLDDRFSMTSATSAVGPLLLPSGNIVDNVTDRINTGNNFNGFDIGLRGQWFYDRWLVKATAKVAFGATDESADISGETHSITPTGLPVVVNSGFLARPSNSGNIKNEVFTVVPELNLTVAYMVCDWMRVNVGYSFLYWSSVARSGDQVNLNINPFEVPSLRPQTGFVAAPPTSLLKCTDFWAHGINVGLEIRF